MNKDIYDSDEKVLSSPNDESTHLEAKFQHNNLPLTADQPLDWHDFITNSQNDSRKRAKRLNTDSGVFIRTVVGGVIVAGVVAFAISFSALYEVAAWLGLPPFMWWAVPIFIDLAILVYAGVALVLKARGERTWPAWCSLAFFTGLSVVANAAHAMSFKHTEQWQTWIGAILAAAVPLAIFLATEMLAFMAVEDPESRKNEVKERAEMMTFLAEQEQARKQQEFEFEQVEWQRDQARAEQAHNQQLQAKRYAVELANIGQQELSTLTEKTSATVSAPEVEKKPTEPELKKFVRDKIERGQTVSGAMVAEFLGVSDRTGRRRLNALQDEDPQLFEHNTESSLSSENGEELA